MSCLVGIDPVKWLIGNIMLSSSCLSASENVVSFFLPFVNKPEKEVQCEPGRCMYCCYFCVPTAILVGL